MQYKVGSGSYKDATSSVTPGTATLATSYWNTDYLGGGTSSKPIAYNDYTYNRGVKTATVTLTASAGTGFTLDGIYKNGSSTKLNSGTTYTIDGANTYYARYSAKQYSITLNLTGGKTFTPDLLSSETTPSDAVVSWASGYTAPTSRYYTQSTTLPTASDVTATGRVFLGWYDNANCTGTAVTSISATTAANKTYYAKWKWDSYTITYNKGSGTSITGTVSNGTKTYGTAYTITSDTFSRPGFTQVGWSTTENATSVEYNFGDSYSTDAALTLYPVWELNTPTAKLNGGQFTVGTGAYINLLNGGTNVISAKPSDVNRTISYAVTGPTGGGSVHATTSGTGTPTDTAAYFFATIPGTYTVSVTVTDTATTGVINANSKAEYTTTVAPAANPTSATIHVLPVVPTFTLDVNGYGDGNGTSTAPYKIFLGNDYDFTATVTNAQSGYTYEWSLNDDFSSILATGSSITFNNDDPKVVDDGTANYSATRALAAMYDKDSLTIYCRAEANGQYNPGNGGVTTWYVVKPLVEQLTFLPAQKIFNANNPNVSLSAEYNLPGSSANGYTTNLYFSHDHADYTTLAQTVQDTLMESFDNVIRTYFMPAGPKFFLMDITGVVNSRTIRSGTKVHTTVGTTDSDASKPVYFYNKTGTSFAAYEVMCYWIDSSKSSGYGYQLAQDLYKDDANECGTTYRVNVPASATKIQFAMIKKDSDNLFYYYPTPTLSSETFSFDPRYYWGYTNMVTLTASDRVIRTASTAPAITSQTIGTESYTMYSVSGCTADTYTTNN
ncbi:MAG: InlB B-repeat-containing protein [Ruminococcus sp.]|nr:InlB B-repeat-containing protein [Ruminococcus sp.]